MGWTGVGEPPTGAFQWGETIGFPGFSLPSVTPLSFCGQAGHSSPGSKSGEWASTSGQVWRSAFLGKKVTFCCAVSCGVCAESLPRATEQTCKLGPAANGGNWRMPLWLLHGWSCLGCEQAFVGDQYRESFRASRGLGACVRAVCVYEGSAFSLSLSPQVMATWPLRPLPGASSVSSTVSSGCPSA